MFLIISIFCEDIFGDSITGDIPFMEKADDVLLRSKSGFGITIFEGVNL